MKTATEIQSDILRLVRESSIMEALNGGLYREGTRPRDSSAEDLIISVTSADGEQVQMGVVLLTVYVADLIMQSKSSKASGHKSLESYANLGRCAEVERMLTDFVSGLTAQKSEYLFSLSNAVYTSHDTDISQSRVMARLRFRCFR